MLFGFTLAVIVGFLFTAGRNWTGRPTPAGWPLAALALLWLARACARADAVRRRQRAGANVAFPLGRGGRARGSLLSGPASRPQLLLRRLLVLLAVAAGCIHLAQLGIVAAPPGSASGRLDVVLFIIAVMAGRVIPMFTNNGVRGARRRRAIPPSSARRSARCCCCSRSMRPADGLADARRRRRGRARACGPVGVCGSRGRRCACRWSGCCSWRTCGCRCTCSCAAVGELGLVTPSLRSTR
jgi:hypothetical protein